MTDAAILPALPAALRGADGSIIRSLEPVLQEFALRHYEALQAQGIRLQFNSGRRTRERQAELYADTLKAQTAADLAARGLTGITAAPGTSLHEFGLAYDGEPDPKTEATWAVYGRTAQSLGLTWGGGWSRKLPDGTVVTDRPHVQLPGKSDLLRQLAGAGLLAALTVGILGIVARNRKGTPHDQA